MSWPVLKKAWPLLRRLNKKHGAAFAKAIRGVVNKRKALPKDSRHDFFSLVATDESVTEDGLKLSDLWAEAVFILPAGKQDISFIWQFYSCFLLWRYHTLTSSPRE